MECLLGMILIIGIPCLIYRGLSRIIGGRMYVDLYSNHIRNCTVVIGLSSVGFITFGIILLAFDLMSMDGLAMFVLINLFVSPVIMLAINRYFITRRR